jgi:hypothetical protein
MLSKNQGMRAEISITASPADRDPVIARSLEQV